uniref:Uncharacterized protein n=1 Tax=Oryza nivara TaxID=4536 RepID=A0A0E0IKK1_ORYNI
MEQKPSGGKGRMSSARSVASPSAARVGGGSSAPDVEQQKSVAAVGASSPVSSSKHHHMAKAEDGTITVNGDKQQNPAADRNGFVRCMDTAARSEVMNHSLQKYVIHFDGCHPLPMRNPRKRCAWCSLRDIRAACDMNFRSNEATRGNSNGCEHVSKENK